MNIVPDHVKELVDRLVFEFENAYDAGEIFYTRLTVGEQVYLGKETTKYYRDLVRDFRRNLDSESGPLFEGKPKEIIKKIYYTVEHYYEMLSVPAIGRVKNKVECQDQLMKRLKKAKNNLELAADATCMLEFIQDAAFSSLGQTESYMNDKKFVLVQTEENFSALLKSEDVEDVTSKSEKPFLKIRVAYKEVPVREQYVKKHLLRKFIAFWNRYANKPECDEYFKILNFWNGINNAAIYYVYVPKNLR